MGKKRNVINTDSIPAYQLSPSQAAEKAAHTAAAKQSQLAINNSTASKSQEQKLKRQLAAAESRGATGKHLEQKSSLLVKSQWRQARLGDKGRSTKSSKGFSR